MSAVYNSIIQDFCAVALPDINNSLETITIRYDTIICNAHNVCQLAESEARAVTGGTWQG